MVTSLCWRFSTSRKIRVIDVERAMSPPKLVGACAAVPSVSSAGRMTTM